jgi:hypothetical protein
MYLTATENIYKQTVMNKNRKDYAIYKSQASQRNNQMQPISKLYGSGATINSPQRSPTKIA